ncbi:MAG: S-methyl-5'-thioadenosine phosphorylase [Candidatus Aminicenantaceae bacterium]
MAGESRGKDRRVDIGILGGTGLYEIEGLKNIEKVELETPFGKPSEVYVLGELEGKKVAFLSRHGKGHRILPLEINYRANIYGFKMLGAEQVVSVSAVGSLKEEIKPQDIVLSDQFFDRTRRKNTFFGEGIAAHISFAQPVCPHLSGILYTTGKELGLRVLRGGTYICIEGPAFSSLAESNIYRSWGCDVIGMTSATEAKLCREAEICYATMNLVTDYDTWHLSEESVSVEVILENLRKNIHNVKAIIKKAVTSLSVEERPQCECGVAIENIVVTKPEMIPEETKYKLRFIIGKYIKV